MKHYEKKLAAKLLRLASDKFSNFGCNDFDMEEAGELSPEEQEQLIRDYHEYNQNGEPMEPDDIEQLEHDLKHPRYALGDWCLMDLLAHKLERD